MSIIHDALKKAQQEQTKTTASPANIFEAPRKSSNQIDDDLPIEHLASSPKRARSVLALLCAIALTVGSFVFCYKQLHPYFSRAERWVAPLFDKLIHRKGQSASVNTPTRELVPLAKITVTPKPVTLSPAPAVKAAVLSPAAIPATPAAVAITAPPETQTLDVHGVMANGPNNVALINDQVYQEGDDIDGIKIIKINLDYITVLRDGKEEKIRVKN